jgi:hypothetical protein
MSSKDFTVSFVVDQSPKEIFDAINHVSGWWSENIEGITDRHNGEFDYRYQNIHICKLKVIEFIPDQKVVWLVVRNQFSFTKDKNEWTGTKISFEILKKGNKTELRFTHIGLVPSEECYEVCEEAWTTYILTSLKDLVTTGKGQPNPREGGYNQELAEKYALH